MRHMPSVMRAEGDGHCVFVVLFVVVSRRLYVCVQEVGRLLAAVHPEAVLWAIKDRRELWMREFLNERLGECVFTKSDWG